MLSRAAEAVYWMERYRERAENTARLADCSRQLSLDASPGRENPWESVIQASGDETLYRELLAAPPVEAAAMAFLTFDERNPNSILSCLAKSRDNARSVREIIPDEMWQEINTAYLYAAHAARERPRGPVPHSFYERIKRHCQVVTAIADATMTRDEAWHFGRLGYMLERSDKTSRLLDVKYFLVLPSVEYVGAPYDNVQWSALLESAGAFEMFRKKHQQVLHANVVEFLALDPDFPRSILHCLAEAEASLRAVAGLPAGRPAGEPERLLGRLRSDLGFMMVADVMRRGLHEFLDDVQTRINEVHAALADAFFAPRLAAADAQNDQQ